MKPGDYFEFNGIKYYVLDVLFTGNSVYYKCRGECGAVKIYPESIEKHIRFRRI
jgi:hypothetical protein